MFYKQPSGFQTLQGRNTHKKTFQKKYWGEISLGHPQLQKKEQVFPTAVLQRNSRRHFMDFIIHLDAVLEG